MSTHRSRSRSSSSGTGLELEEGTLMAYPPAPEEEEEEARDTPEEAVQPCSSYSEKEELGNNALARASQHSVNTRSSTTSLAASLKSSTTSAEFAAATPLKLKANMSTKSSHCSADPQSDYPNSATSMIQAQHKQEIPELNKACATTNPTAPDDDMSILDSIAPLPSIAAPQEPSLPGAFHVLANGDRPPPNTTTTDSTANPSSWHQGDVEQGTAADSDDAKSVVEGSLQLVEATPLSDSSESFGLPKAEEDDSDISHRQRAQKNARFYGAIIAALVVLLLSAGIVGYILGRQESSNSNIESKDGPTITTTPVATSAPSIHNTTADTEIRKSTALLSVLSQYLPDSTVQLLVPPQEEETPQYQAFQWVLQDPNLESYDDHRILQRFAAASIYYSTQGDAWTHRGGEPTIAIPFGHPKKPDFVLNLTNTTAWLSHDECDWFSVPTNAKEGAGLLCEGADGGSLVNLNLVFNNLNGTLPPQIQLLTHLEQLWVPRNPQLRGPLPTQLGRLKQLNTLVTRGCAFGGSLPSELGRLSNTLTEFNAFRNQHTGSIPTQLWDMPRLEFWGLGQNRLTGSIPRQTDLPKLQVLRLARNQMTGRIPGSLSKSPDLRELDLADNRFTGSIPSELGLLADLVELELGENQLTGTLPSQLGQLSRLAFLNVEGNAGLTGSLPSHLGLLEQLESIHLKDAPGLTGSLPDQWRRLNATLQSLVIQGTSISGTIPDELCGIESLMFDCSPNLCGCHCPCVDNSIHSNSTLGHGLQ